MYYVLLLVFNPHPRSRVLSRNTAHARAHKQHSRRQAESAKILLLSTELPRFHARLAARLGHVRHHLLVEHTCPQPDSLIDSRSLSWLASPDRLGVGYRKEVWSRALLDARQPKTAMHHAGHPRQRAKKTWRSQLASPVLIYHVFSCVFPRLSSCTCRSRACLQHPADAHPQLTPPSRPWS